MTGVGVGVHKLLACAAWCRSGVAKVDGKKSCAARVLGLSRSPRGAAQAATLVQSGRHDIAREAGNLGKC